MRDLILAQVAWLLVGSSTTEYPRVFELPPITRRRAAAVDVAVSTTTVTPTEVENGTYDSSLRIVVPSQVSGIHASEYDAKSDEDLVSPSGVTSGSVTNSWMHETYNRLVYGLGEVSGPLDLAIMAVELVRALHFIYGMADSPISMSAWNEILGSYRDRYVYLYADTEDSEWIPKNRIFEFASPGLRELLGWNSPKI